MLGFFFKLKYPRSDIEIISLKIVLNCAFHQLMMRDDESCRSTSSTELHLAMPTLRQGYCFIFLIPDQQNYFNCVNILASPGISFRTVGKQLFLQLESLLKDICYVICGTVVQRNKSKTCLHGTTYVVLQITAKT